MRKLTCTFAFLFLLLLSPTISAEPLRGVVRDASGSPVAGAVVTSGPFSATSDVEGRFDLDLVTGSHVIAVEQEGFERVSLRAVVPGQVVIQLRPALAESIEVSGIRAEDEIPVTKSEMQREEIERRYHGQDVPLLMRDLPSIHAYAESGVGGAGYSYISLRGVSSSRINFTLDGVPLADAEDMATYFADFPDLASSLQSVQVQRGVGTSTVGSASFGGSVNLESIDLAATRQIDARVSAGSFGQRTASAAYQSGWLPSGVAFYSRLSVNESDGYREHSSSKQRNLFVSAAKQLDESSRLRLTGFTAHERQQMSFLATDADTLRLNRRENPLAPEETDSFGYDLAQLQYIRALSSDTDMTASVYYQRGYGWYRLFDDNVAGIGLREYGLDGQLIGSLVTMNWRRGGFDVSGGVHLNRFRREHTRGLVTSESPRDYFNAGTKREVNAFAKGSLSDGPWVFYGDAQIRSTDFSYRGDVDIASARWTFFNPRVGARYVAAPGTSVYASLGRSSREPARADFFHGEDNPTIAYDVRAVKPERVWDYEAGVEMRGRRGSITTNLYAMEFRDEIAATGELSDIGLPLRRNVDRSYRRGVEIEAEIVAGSRLRFETAANFSRNRIASWSQSYDVYDDEGNWLESRLLTHRNVEPLLTPSVLISQSAEWRPLDRLQAGLTARYVGATYLDNTNNDAFRTPSMITADATLRFDATPRVRVSLQANNVTDRKMYASGYSYLTMTPAGAIGGTPYYYPQAGRHFIVMLDFRH